MTNTLRVRITTTDTDWINRYGFPVDSNGDAIVPVTDVERITFASVPMIRFDLQAAASTLPRDCMNRWAMLPATRVVANA